MTASKYEGLSREELEARLAGAEDVCVMWAWSGSAAHATDREKAAHELWIRWVDVSGNKCSLGENPHLSDEAIADLAAQRDATRAEVMRRLDERIARPSETL